MKKFILLIIALVVLVNVTAQEMGFNYKALVSDTSGDPIANAEDVWIQFAILQDGSVIYQELYDNETTDINGILITNIGEGEPSIGIFSEIDWALDYSLRVSIDAGSGVSVYTPTPFKAVPYAKYAAYGKDEDDNPNNEIQNLSLIGNQLSISSGSTVTLPEGTTYTAGTGISISGSTITNTGDADADPNNEIQNLSIIGNQLSISSGSTVTLPEGINYTAGTGISILGSTITNTGDTDPNDDIVLLDGVATVNGDIVITGEIQNPTISGDADMKAYMYGWVSSSGSIVTSASSNGFTVERIDADGDGTDDPGKYKIVYNTSFPGYSSYIIQINLIEANFTPGFVNSYQWSGNCDVYTYDIAGAFIDKQFSFIIYKK